MKIKLTAEQKKHLKSIQWLYAGARGSGRTTLLAYALIDAVLYTGQDMRIIDHYPNRQADMNLASLIDTIIKGDDLTLEISKEGLILKSKIN